MSDVRGGVDYGPDAVQDIRRQLVVIRDGALTQGAMDWAVILTHAIAILWDYREKIHGITTDDLQEGT